MALPVDSYSKVENGNPFLEQIDYIKAQFINNNSIENIENSKQPEISYSQEEIK